MLSLLGEGDRCFCCAAADAGKNGEVLESELSAGDSGGGLLERFDEPSARNHGPLALESETADSTGDAACGD